MSTSKAEESKATICQEQPVTNNSDKIDRIIADAEKHYSKGRNPNILGETVFAKIVIGAQVDLVRGVLGKLDSKKSILKYLTIGSSCTKGTASSTDGDRQCGNGKCTVVKSSICKIILLTIFWVISTPFFYALFALISKGINSSFLMEMKRKLSKFKKIDNPLALAVFSGNEDMVKLFLTYTNNNIGMVDSNGNNVMHYVADLSSVGLEHSLLCFKLLQNIVNNTEIPISNQTLKELCKDERNIYSQTPVEHAIQYGRIPFALALMDYSMTDAGLGINENIISHSPDGNGKTIYWLERRLDISNYINFRNGVTSYLIGLLLSRQTTMIPADDLWAVTKHACIQKWMKQKYIQWRHSITITVIIEVIASILLTLVMVQGQGNMKFVPNKDAFINYSVKDFLQKFNSSFHAGNGTLTRDLKWAPVFFEDHKEFLHKVLSSDKVNIDFYQLRTMIHETNLKYYDNEYLIEDMSGLYHLICTKGNEHMQVGDLVILDSCTKKAAELVADSCKKQTSYHHGNLQGKSAYEFAVATSFKSKIHTHRKSSFTNYMGKALNIQSEKTNIIILLTLFSYFIVYLTIDLYSRLFTLFHQILIEKCLLSTIFATPIQGSLVKSQAAVFSASMFMVFIGVEVREKFEYFWHGGAGYEACNLIDEFIDYNRFATSDVQPSLIWISILVSRIILHLHAMRLIPWIGKFVITTFRMAADLFQFAVIYILIVALFSCIFYAFSRDSVCTTWEESQHQEFYDSLFTTFALTYGHIDLNFSNAAMKFTYIVYVVISVILLLNLIIAVMSSTATSITVQPWSTQLFKKCRLNEALGIEHTMLTLDYIYPQLSPCYWWSFIIRFCWNCKCCNCPCDLSKSSFYKMGRVDYVIENPDDEETYYDENFNAEEDSAYVYVVELVNKDKTEPGEIVQPTKSENGHEPELDINQNWKTME